MGPPGPPGEGKPGPRGQPGPQGIAGNELATPGKQIPALKSGGVLEMLIIHVEGPG